MNSQTFRVLNAGEVSLVSQFGDDLAIVNAAKVSFASYETEMTEKAAGLLNYLIKNKHATPFEHSVFKFYIKCPIFIAREWMRHRWSSFNEMSMRYHVPQTMDFYTPKKDAIRKQVGKPGAYTFEKFETDREQTQAYARVIQKFNKIYSEAEDAYRELIKHGIAKEVARSVLPVGQYTEFIWTVNARSLMNFLSLRNDINAQLEIREYAEIIENIMSEVLPDTYSSWVANGREAI